MDLSDPPEESEAQLGPRGEALTSSIVPYRVCSSQPQIPLYGSAERHERSTSLAHSNREGKCTWQK